ncbi:NHL repeat-containing protein 2-like [Xenia sp. Carnegie-2017]|uniref:NHL repeat-containing protein 2-like n=1 Tax=Xenia sp. Carnegie-2017 TaxID=2897299 RepID=UPI001F050261|nr:NHL repeat-containing protein 2-like [Xenia sp. Carnegie-2017]
MEKDKALSIKGNLRGKICVLDFFTYCCINCLHVLPDLHQLESNYSIEDGLVVVGVHSAKFENEKVSTNILNAILRYDITHPVINDNEAVLWNAMEIACWPTLVIVGPNGQLLLTLVGEGHHVILMEFVDAALKWFKSVGEIKDHSINISLAKNSLPKTNLLFPGKISLNESGDQLAISNSGHHQILLVDVGGNVMSTVGKGIAGLVDGDFKVAQFNSPQGVAWHGNQILYVADTENHAIRKINLKEKVVSTVAGMGTQGNDKVGGKTGKDQAISSPWDVVIGPSPGALDILHDESVLYIAMAGTHQIWGLCLSDTKWLKRSDEKAMTCLRFSGSGAEENRNNSYPHKTGFAQPSGLSVAREKPLECIFLADSESSSVRSVSIVTGGSKALVGADRDPMNLFAFGDIDGKGVDAKLQHPLAVAWNSRKNELYVADSYNHKIKVIDPLKKTCTTMLGTGQAGCVDGEIKDAQFNEPGGLCVSADGNVLYIADTNSHVIRKVDIKGAKVSTLPILSLVAADVDALADSADNIKDPREKYRRLAPKNAKIIQCNPVKVNDNSLDVQFTYGLPAQCKLTEGVKSKWQCTAFKDSLEEDARVLHSGVLPKVGTPSSFVAKMAENSETQIKVEAKIYFCEPDGACYMQGIVYVLPVVHHGEGSLKDDGPVKLHFDCTKP